MIYLDNAATTRPKTEVLNAVKYITEKYWYNPSASYESAQKVMKLVYDTKKNIADSIGAQPEEIIITSGASESNALAIDGWKKANIGTEVVSSMMEHPSILKNPNVNPVICNDSDGFIDLLELDNHCKMKDCKQEMISIAMANSEIGTVQNVKAISNIIHKYGDVYHCDATQSYGKVPINVEEMGIDLLSASSHKIGGIKGCGFLYVKSGIKIKPIIYGTQQDGLRGGTYNIPGIAGLYQAVKCIDLKQMDEIKQVRNYLFYKLLRMDGINVNGSIISRLPNNVNFKIKGINISGQQIVGLLDRSGIMVSAGSACHSYSPEPSHVLKAIGLSDEDALKSIRVTVGENTTIEEIDEFIKVLKFIIETNRE